MQEPLDREFPKERNPRIGFVSLFAAICSIASLLFAFANLDLLARSINPLSVIGTVSAYAFNFIGLVFLWINRREKAKYPLIKIVALILNIILFLLHASFALILLYDAFA